jgi:hypothetical protein
MIEAVIAPITPIPPIAVFGLAKQYGHIIFDGGEHYIKQTIRNRYHILSANGVLSLSSNIKGLHGMNTPTKDVRLDLEKPWQRTHIRALKAAYRSSPFFDHYEKQIGALINDPGQTLLEFFTKSMPMLQEMSKVDFTFEIMNTYQEGTYSVDLRKRIKKPEDLDSLYRPKPYVQVFSDRFPFSSNLSVLDLIFNVGPGSANYL